MSVCSCKDNENLSQYKEKHSFFLLIINIVRAENSDGSYSLILCLRRFLIVDGTRTSERSHVRNRGSGPAVDRVYINFSSLKGTHSIKKTNLHSSCCASPLGTRASIRDLYSAGQDLRLRTCDLFEVLVPSAIVFPKNKLRFILLFAHLIVPLAPPKVLSFGKNLCLRRFLIKETQMYCSRLFVPLASPKVLSLVNKNKLRVILYCSRLFVPLQQ